MTESLSLDATKASFTLRSRNPDVLSCIANLSNDEVFTPPEFANRMLDTLEEGWAAANDGADIWSDPTVKFLDPFTKSGVFLREITKRLTVGLADHIPDLEDRVDHILTRQVYGIGITEITTLLARRSLYCSKWANGAHSIAKSFDDPDGNIWFDRTEHTWVGGTEWVYTADENGNQVKKFTNGKCEFCGTSQTMLDRGADAETHAYAFIHAHDVKRLLSTIFGESMQFDVVIGNPPYQLSDGGGEGASATPLYHHFVEQAKTLDAKHLIMVIPARWYSGGKGLNTFRKTMLGDQSVAEIHDFPETSMVFPGVNIRGGVCYFRRSQGHHGLAKITNHRSQGAPSISERPLLEPGLETFVRYNEAVSILRKVRELGEPTYDGRVQSRNPFGIPSNFSHFSSSRTKQTPVTLYRSRRGTSVDKEVYIALNQIKSNLGFKDRIKVLVSKASPGGDEYPHAVFSKPFVAPEGSVSTETYLIVDFADTQMEADNLVGYMQTRFFRFLVSLIKTTQNISKGSFAFVPVQDLSQSWTDKKLYEKYNITDEEVTFIESMIRSMELAADD